jgi:hypothetical protein
VNQVLTALTVQLLDNELIEHWGRWGRAGGRVTSRPHKARGEGARILFLKTLGLFGGVATFFTSKIPPNGDPKINPLTLSKGFFMKIFNNFGRKTVDVWRGWGIIT